MKQLYDVYTNDRVHVLVKADQDDLEKMVHDGKIIDYKLPKIYKIRDIAE